MADPSSPRRRLRPRATRATLFLAVGLTMAAASLVGYAFGLLRPLELGSVDARFGIRGDEQPPGDVVVVKIDDVTFQELGAQWPFRRSIHARTIERLHAAGAKVIVYDVQFTEPTTPKEDDALIEAVDRARPVVLATTEVNADGGTNVFGGDDVLASVGARVGNALMPTDPGGTIRRLAYQVDGLKGLAVVAAEVARKRKIRPSDLDGRTAWIDFAGEPGTFTSISLSRVLARRFAPDLFRGKVVVVGPTAPSLQDVHPTSTSGDGVMSGAELQANAVATALRGFPLSGASHPLNGGLILLLALLPPAAALRLSPFRGLALSLAAAGLYVVATQIVFQHGLILSFVYPLGALLVASAGALAVHYTLAAFERERVRGVFARFVPETVVNQVLAQTDDALRLGGVRKECTVMFSDLRGFTTFSESRAAEEVIEILNRYLGEMSEAIFAHGGTLVSYIGDGIMAVFGAPLEQPDHADRSLAAAREMLDVRLPHFNEWLRARIGGDGFRMGIGLNSGAVMAGNVGSERRLEYTVIGDVTNTASRIEGLTKGTPHSLFVSESTHRLLSRAPAVLQFVDEFEIRGREGRIRLWALAAGAEPAAAGGQA